MGETGWGQTGGVLCEGSLVPWGGQQGGCGQGSRRGRGNAAAGTPLSSRHHIPGSPCPHAATSPCPRASTSLQPCSTMSPFHRVLVSLCLCTTMSLCHHVPMPPHPHVTTSLCHCVLMYLSATTSLCHCIPNLPCRHATVSPHPHATALPCHNTPVPPHLPLPKFPRCHIPVSPCPHATASLSHHIPMSPRPRATLSPPQDTVPARGPAAVPGRPAAPWRSPRPCAERLVAGQARGLHPVPAARRGPAAAHGECRQAPWGRGCPCAPRAPLMAAVPQEVAGVSFITQLATRSDHLPVALRLDVAPDTS